MTDAELRAHLIAAGALRPAGARVRVGVVSMDHAGKRSAAADIFFGEGPEMAQFVVENPNADPEVKVILRRWLARREAA